MSAAANSAVSVTSDAFPARRARPRARASPTHPRDKIHPVSPGNRTDSILPPPREVLLAHRRYVVPQILQHVRWGRAWVPEGALPDQGESPFPPMRARDPRGPGRLQPRPCVLVTPVVARVLTSCPPYLPRSQAKPREAVYFKATPWSGGKPGKSGE